MAQWSETDGKAWNDVGTGYWTSKLTFLDQLGVWGTPNFGQVELENGPKETHAAIFGPPWPWAKFGGTHLTQIGPKLSAWTWVNPFQLCSPLFQPFRTTEGPRSNFGQFLGHFLALEVTKITNIVCRHWNWTSCTQTDEMYNMVDTVCKKEVKTPL